MYYEVYDTFFFLGLNCWGCTRLKATQMDYGDDHDTIILIVFLVEELWLVLRERYCEVYYLYGSGVMGRDILVM